MKNCGLRKQQAASSRRWSVGEWCLNGAQGSCYILHSLLKAAVRESLRLKEAFKNQFQFGILEEGVPINIQRLLTNQHMK